MDKVECGKPVNEECGKQENEECSKPVKEECLSRRMRSVVSQ